jgi:hypothetical protein
MTSMDNHHNLEPIPFADSESEGWMEKGVTYGKFDGRESMVRFAAMTEDEPRRLRRNKKCGCLRRMVLRSFRMETVFSDLLTRRLVRETILGTVNGRSVQTAIRTQVRGRWRPGNHASQLSQTAPWGEVG